MISLIAELTYPTLKSYLLQNITVAARARSLAHSLETVSQVGNSDPHTPCHGLKLCY